MVRVGLDRGAATDAFSEFLVGRTLTGDQIDFITVIIEHLTENGVMEPSRLYESPLIDRAPQGPDSLFPSADVDRSISILHSVRAFAVSAAEVA